MNQIQKNEYSNMENKPGMKMRRLFMLPLLAAMLFQTACSSSNKAQPTASRKEIKGSWILNNITYVGLEPGAKYNIALLDEGSADCLKGSAWVLPNNGFGSYKIISNETGCVPGERKINWSYRMEDGETMFRYKLLEEGVKAKKVTEGYKLKVVSADNTAMQLQQETAVDGKMVYINYHFTSIQ